MRAWTAVLLQYAAFAPSWALCARPAACYPGILQRTAPGTRLSCFLTLAVIVLTFVFCFCIELGQMFFVPTDLSDAVTSGSSQRHAFPLCDIPLCAEEQETLVVSARA